MDALYSRLYYDAMLKTCREIMPVTREMTEEDSQQMAECFARFTGAYFAAEEIMRQSPSTSFGLIGGPRSRNLKSSKARD